MKKRNYFLIIAVVSAVVFIVSLILKEEMYNSIQVDNILKYIMGVSGIISLSMFAGFIAYFKK